MVKQYLIDSKYIVEGWLETLLVSPNEEYKKLYEASIKTKKNGYSIQII